jgi:hypothetical protein
MPAASASVPEAVEPRHRGDDGMSEVRRQPERGAVGVGEWGILLQSGRETGCESGWESGGAARLGAAGPAEAAESE